MSSYCRETATAFLAAFCLRTDCGLILILACRGPTQADLHFLDLLGSMLLCPSVFRLAAPSRFRASIWVCKFPMRRCLQKSPPVSEFPSARFKLLSTALVSIQRLISPARAEILA